jgi:hypothetical protein
MPGRLQHVVFLQSWLAPEQLSDVMVVDVVCVVLVIVVCVVAVIVCVEVVRVMLVVVCVGVVRALVEVVFVVANGRARVLCVEVVRVVVRVVVVCADFVVVCAEVVVVVLRVVVVCVEVVVMRPALLMSPIAACHFAIAIAFAWAGTTWHGSTPGPNTFRSMPCSFRSSAQSFSDSGLAGSRRICGNAPLSEA